MKLHIEFPSKEQFRQFIENNYKFRDDLRIGQSIYTYLFRIGRIIFLLEK